MLSADELSEMRRLLLKRYLRTLTLEEEAYLNILLVKRYTPSEEPNSSTTK